MILELLRKDLQHEVARHIQPLLRVVVTVVLSHLPQKSPDQLTSHKTQEIGLLT
jgi:hypothetical protein